MILVFTEEQNERLKYTFDFIFNQRGISYELTSEKGHFEDFNGPKFNYSSQIFETSPQIVPGQLLFETGIQKQHVSLQVFNEWECLAFDGVTDMVASVFYVLTCYESYDSTESDNYGRFQYESSILNLFDWIDKAVCDRWAFSLIKLIDENIYHSLNKEQSQLIPRLVPTFDIDNAFAYKYKKGKRKWLSIIRDIINRDRKRLRERRLVNSGKMTDPYDSYDKIKEIIESHPDTKLFWLMKSDGQYDRNLSAQVEEHRQLISNLAAICDLGLHPSYDSFLNVEQVRTEKGILEEIIAKPIDQSRQHYLKLKLPESYRTLIEIGIEEDYSMGFAEHYGFRAGTARSFYWYDLENDLITGLLVNPFVYMDGTMHEYMDLEVEKSKRVIDKLFNEVSRFGGDFCFIWHNETISDYGKWNGWSNVLNYTLNLKDE